jgi:cytochrome P450
MIGHISGSTSLLLTEGEEWKRIRSLFNPGFAIGHLMTLVPSIVDDGLIFWNKLDELSNTHKVSPLEDLLARLFIDIMGHIILDHDLNAQTTENELVAAFRSAVEWTPIALATHWIFNLNPMKQFYHWLYARRMDHYLGKVIRDRLEKRGSEKGASKVKSSRRPAIDLAMDEYLLQDTESKSINNEAPVLDAYFMQVAIDQMKSFLFAGHDTSSSTMCFVYNMLNFHPEALAEVREEHDKVIGPASSAAETIRNNPQLLNELPYTAAVIKGTLTHCSHNFDLNRLTFRRNSPTQPSSEYCPRRRRQTLGH